MRLDIEDCLAQVESCFNLLIPRFDIPDIFSSAESQESNPELSPVPRNDRDTESEVGAVRSDGEEEKERRERKRKRTTSFCSFVSLSSGGDSDDDQDDDGEEMVAPVQTPNLENIRNEEELTENDEDILAHLYTSSSCSGGHGLKLGVATSTGSSKGKGKMKNVDDFVVKEMKKEEGKGDGGSDSDTSSDVEWEDVPISASTYSGSHDRAALLDNLQEHGLMTRGFSIPITIELGSQPEVKETEDNTSILATLQECKQLLAEKHLPAINKFMEVGEGEVFWQKKT